MRKIFITLYCLTLLILLVTCDNLKLINDKFYNVDIHSYLDNCLSNIEFTDHSLDTDFIFLRKDIDGIPIIWESTDSRYLDSSGRINKPDLGEGEVELTLRASMSFRGTRRSRDFNFTVEPGGSSREIITVDDLDLEMVLVESGIFLMDSREFYHSRSYYISSTPISENLFNRVIYGSSGGDNPKTNISYSEAVDFTGRLSLITGRTFKIPNESQLYRGIYYSAVPGTLYEYTSDSFRDEVSGFENPENSAYPGDYLVVLKEGARESRSWSVKESSLGFRVIIPN